MIPWLGALDQVDSMPFLANSLETVMLGGRYPPPFDFFKSKDLNMVGFAKGAQRPQVKSLEFEINTLKSLEK